MNVLKLAWSASLLASMLTYAQTPEAPLKSTIPAPDESNRKGDMARLAQQKSEERFDATDDDKDGQLSRAEVARHLPFFDANFERYDKNKDGMLSWDEFVGHGQWSRQRSR